MSSKNSITRLIVILCGTCAALVCHAAETPDMAVSASDVLRISGLPMYVLVGISVIALAFVIYFFLTLRREQIVPSALRSALAETVRSGSLEDVRGLCDQHPSPLAGVAGSAVRYLGGVSEPDTALLKEIVQGEGARRAEAIQGQTRYLMDIAAVAPMIGLLGTVLGMVKAFGSVSVSEVVARPVVLANGVRQALFTTAAGLVIAIPAMIFYAYFRERANKMVSHLETASAEFLTGLLSRKRDGKRVFSLQVNGRAGAVPDGADH